MFHFLKQREQRWFRYDPCGTLGAIRSRRDLPSHPDGSPLAARDTCQANRWPGTGAIFETGPFFGCTSRHSLDEQMAWLERVQPDYLLMLASDLEHLALHYQGCPPPPELRAIQSISQQLTPAMRKRVERTFSVPVHENYGLNEVGIVASRCPEGGRFHVHVVHCIVEIVDEDGDPCGPGECGRILVTCVTNRAMPLLRYDTGDLAETVEGPCPCGRTLPSFGRLVGRYRRRAFLPPGSWHSWIAVQRTLADMPSELSGPLRQYQLHEYRDGHFELRLVTAGPLPEGFSPAVRSAWLAAAPGERPQLDILLVDRIPLPPSGKFESFTSDFMPERDEMQDESTE
jgi:phenylacetate-CoA ligase